MGILESAVIDITCPTCRRKISKSVRQLKAEKNLTCRCGQVIDLAESDFARQIRDAEKALANLGNTLGKLSK